jgi:hypothetical protein
MKHAIIFAFLAFAGGLLGALTAHALLHGLPCP